MDGMIGLGFTPNSYEIQFSILEQFYRNKIISHRVYMQKFSSEKSGEILFGELPEEAFNDTIHYGRCSAVDVQREGKKYKNKNWQCQINAIFFTEKNNFQVVNENEWMKFNNKNIAFNSNNKRSYIPKTLLETFIDIYFKDLIESKKCEVKEKRHSVSFGQSNTFQFKAMKAMFQESHDAEKPKKLVEADHKKFLESRKKSIKNEYSLVKELMKKNKNIIEEEDDSDEEVKKNTDKNVKIGKEALNEDNSSSSSHSSDNEK